VSFAKLVGVALAGDPMLITSDLRPAEEAAAELHFLGTNFRTAQGATAISTSTSSSGSTRSRS
jgi:hypothetical protein